MYHQKSFQLDLEKLPPTSPSIHIHIKWAFSVLSLAAYTFCLIEINPEDYGYELTEDDVLVPTITSKDLIQMVFQYHANI